MPTSSLTIVDATTTLPKKVRTLRALKKPQKPALIENNAVHISKPRKRQKSATVSTKKIPAIKEPVVLHAHPHSHTKTHHVALKREPLGHLLAEKLLKEAGFKGGISTDKHVLDRYSNDESIFTIRPQIVLQPKNQKDIEIAVAVLGKETVRFPSLSLTPRAAGTGLGGGSLTDSVVIDVSTHLHHIHEVQSHKDGTTITCEPGALWRDVEKKLKAHGTYIPSYPASKDLCSIGGSVANNAAGPDSLRYGHTANWVESLDVTLYDGKTYTIKPLTYKEFKILSKKNNAYGQILSSTFELIENNERSIRTAKPKTTKNSAGYALWDVLDESVANFKKGKGMFNVCRVICGSQGTIGIITSVTMKAIPIPKHTELIVVPVFDLSEAGKVILKALEHDPLNIELSDGLTFDLALQNPEFFRSRLGKFEFYRVLLALYTTYHVRYARKIPEFTLLITIDSHTKNLAGKQLVSTLRKIGGKRARLITNKHEKEMYWQVRNASYSLSKFLDPHKRPAAFLEDMVVPAKNMPKFFMGVKRLLKKYNVIAAVHGHGGDGHLHFYPLLDFESKTTPQLVMRMTEEFFALAIKHGGDLCGEHNDGIIRTPHLHKMFSSHTLALFSALEHICDPQDIFNPGKKVNPRFDIRSSIRTSNNNAPKS